MTPVIQLFHRCWSCVYIWTRRTLRLIILGLTQCWVHPKLVFSRVRTQGVVNQICTVNHGISHSIYYCLSVLSYLKICYFLFKGYLKICYWHSYELCFLTWQNFGIAEDLGWSKIYLCVVARVDPFVWSTETAVIQRLGFQCHFPCIFSAEKAFLAAWEETCNNEGWPILIIPGGRTFLLKQIKFNGSCKSPIKIQVTYIFGDSELVWDIIPHKKLLFKPVQEANVAWILNWHSPDGW